MNTGFYGAVIYEELPHGQRVKEFVEDGEDIFEVCDFLEQALDLDRSSFGGPHWNLIEIWLDDRFEEE